MFSVADKKLILFAGKGGVGKTTTSSATALWLAKHGKKTLVVTVDPAKRLGDSLDAKVGFKETQIAKNLDALMVDPRTIVAEFLRRHAQDPSKDQDLTSHPLFKYVSEHMPGLNELLAIGKLMELRTKSHYDAIVVDTAPTGHALTFLSAPQYIKDIMSEQGMVNLVIKGWKFYSNAKKLAGGIKGLFTGEEPTIPDIDLEKVFSGIRDEAERIEAMLTDPRDTVLHVVTNPERLAVEETIDILAKVRELKIPTGSVVMNKVQPDSLAELRSQFVRVMADEATKEKLKKNLADAKYNPELFHRVVETVHFNELRRAMNLQHLDDLRKRIDLPIVEVPMFQEEVRGLPALEAFGKHLFGEVLPRRPAKPRGS